LITVYATAWCGDCHLARRVLDEHGVAYRWIDINDHPEAQAVVLAVNGGYRSVPTIVFPDGSVLVEPTRRELTARLAEVAPHNPRPAP
jgi:mycoredoxin